MAWGHAPARRRRRRFRTISAELLGRKFDVNFKDRNGWTPLHRAAERGRLQAAALLIEHGARLDERTLAGETPYNLAVAENNAEVAALLRSKGADQGPPRFPELKGDYLGQKKPGAQPELFAPGIVSSRFGLHCPATFSPDGREAYWNLMVEPRTPGYSISRLLFSRLQDGRWTYPQVAPFTGEGRMPTSPFSHRTASASISCPGGPCPEPASRAASTSGSWSGRETAGLKPGPWTTRSTASPTTGSSPWTRITTFISPRPSAAARGGTISIARDTRTAATLSRATSALR